MGRERDASDVIISSAQYVATLKRWWWVLVLVPLLLALGAYWFVSRQEPAYRASATLLVDPTSPLDQTASRDVQAATLLASTYRELVTSPDVVQRVVVDPRVAGAISTFGLHVEAGASAQAPLVWVTATYADPQLAAAVANATADAFVAWLLERDIQAISSDRTTIQKEIDAERVNMEQTSTTLAELRGRPGARTAEEQGKIASLESVLEQHRTRYADLLAYQQRLELAQLRGRHSVSIAAGALPPANSSNRSPKTYAVLALLFGIGLSGTGIGVVALVDRRVRVPQDVQREVGLPVLATVPRARQTRAASGIATINAPESPAAEAFRTLGTRFQLTVNGRGLGAIVITSPRQNDKASDVAVNLAVSFAQLGQRVVLVEGRLQHPYFHKMFNTKPNSSGLSTLMRDPSAPVEMALVDTHLPRLRLLLAGPGWDGATGQLPSPRLAEVIAHLKQVSDVVVIDAPPVLTEAIALQLAAVADDAIIVAQSGRTRPEDLRLALDTINAARVNVLGVVLDGVERGRAHS